MSILQNAKREAFARAYAISGDATKAHVKAYGAAKSIRVNAANGCRLVTDDNILLRVEEIRKELAPEMKKGMVLSMQEKRAFLALVVRTAIGDIDQLSPLCQQWKEITTEHGGSVEYKMPDKLRAIELDAKLAGELVEQHNHSGTVVVTLDQLKERVDAIRSRRLERENAGRN